MARLVGTLGRCVAGVCTVALVSGATLKPGRHRVGGQDGSGKQFTVVGPDIGEQGDSPTIKIPGFVRPEPGTQLWTVGR